MGAVVGFAPWIVFWTVSGFETFGIGAVAALVTSVVVIAPDVLHHRVKVLDAGTLISFAVLAALGTRPAPVACLRGTPGRSPTGRSRSSSWCRWRSGSRSSCNMLAKGGHRGRGMSRTSCAPR